MRQRRRATKDLQPLQDLQPQTKIMQRTAKQGRCPRLCLPTTRRPISCRPSLEYAASSRYLWEVNNNCRSRKHLVQLTEMQAGWKCCASHE